MNIKLLVVGKTVKGFIDEGVNEYVKRLKHYVNFSIEIIPDVKNASSLSPNQLKEQEAALILKHLTPEDKVVILDEHGKEYRSMEFADYIQKQMSASVKNLVFIVGGAFGFSDSIKEKFPNKISISKMTFSHQMIRLLFVEQIYRAYTIIKHEPYHNE
ncbi:MAG: 23S rRNA (pseudouridine(1915)-N(3))-methyltransferase RlmH [Bacteroidales bacterium]|nr:23S rRNA (pseudouridine(1915)-N(3))-methyltransferase RlmH [Candidatus Scybalousia scybalohippi]